MGPVGTLELQFDKSLTVGTQYPSSGLLIAHPLATADLKQAQIPLMARKQDPPL